MEPVGYKIHVKKQPDQRTCVDRAASHHCRQHLDGRSDRGVEKPDQTRYELSWHTCHGGLEIQADDRPFQEPAGDRRPDRPPGEGAEVSARAAGRDVTGRSIDQS